MENKSVKEKADSIIQNFLREAQVSNNTVVFNQIPEILASVMIDKEVIRNIMLKEVERNSKNPLNAILKLFGIRLISREELRDRYAETSDFIGVEFNEALSVDKEKLTATLNQIAESLLSRNDAFDRESSRLNEKYDKLRIEYNNYREHAENQLNAYQIQIKSVAMNVQYLLALRRKESGISADYTDLSDILEPMNMTAVWPEETAKELMSKHFNVLKVGIPEGALIKPCIMLKQDMLIRGEIIKYEK